MNNTALRAETQSADSTHMVFKDNEHEKFYYEKLEQARYQDCYHKPFISRSAHMYAAFLS